MREMSHSCSVNQATGSDWCGLAAAAVQGQTRLRSGAGLLSASEQVKGQAGRHLACVSTVDVVLL